MRPRAHLALYANAPRIETLLRRVPFAVPTPAIVKVARPPVARVIPPSHKPAAVVAVLRHGGVIPSISTADHAAILLAALGHTNRNCHARPTRGPQPQPFFP